MVKTSPPVTVFPKFFFNYDFSVERLAETVADCDFDGIDLMIRDTAWCTDDDYFQTLPAFVRVVRERGLTCDSVTTNWTADKLASIEDSYRLFRDNGIKRFRILVQPYRGRGTFHADQAKVRKVLSSLEPFGQKYGVTALLQNHGGYYFWSPEMAFSLISGLDPSAIGIHYDPANMWHQEGWTHPTLAVDIMQDYLAYVGVKNIGWFLVPNSSHDQRLQWQRECMRLDLGMVDWDHVLSELAAAKYSGPFCMHNFYANSLEGLIDQTKADVAYFRSLMSRYYQGVGGETHEHSNIR